MKVTYRSLVADAHAKTAAVLGPFPFGLRVDRQGEQYRLSLLWRKGPMRLTPLVTGSAKEVSVAMDAVVAFAANVPITEGGKS